MDLSEPTERMKKRFSELGTDVTESEIREKMELLVNRYRVQLDEAERSVVNQLLRDKGLTQGEYYGISGSPQVKISEIDSDGKWITLRVNVVSLWEPTSENMAQVGIIGDESGTIRFVAWKKADLPALEEGKSYSIGNLVTDSWQGRFSVKLNRTTQITPLEEDVVVGSTEVEVSGAIVYIQQGSGLVKRCEECSRVIMKDMCPEHGKREGVYDIRIKAVIDDGLRAQETILNKELTEQLTGISVQRAEEMAEKAKDREVVLDEFKRQLLGRYYKVQGPLMGRYMLVKQMSPLSKGVNTDEMIAKLEAM